MNKLGRFIVSLSLYSLCVLILLSVAQPQPSCEARVSEDLVWTFEDDEFAMVVELNGVQIGEAEDKGHAVTIKRDGKIDLEVSYRVKGDKPLELDRIGLKYMLTNEHGVNLPFIPQIGVALEGEGSFTQSIDLKDYMGFKDVPVLSGIYRLQLMMDYSVNGGDEGLKSEPFYVRIAGNPLTTVMGAIATFGLAYSGFSLLNTFSQVNNWMTNVFERAVMNSRVSPTDKLRGHYEVRVSDRLQTELSSRIFGFIRDRRAEELCPSCGSEWLMAAESCPGCGLNLGKALEEFSEGLGERCLDACEEMTSAVSGYSVRGLAEKLGQGVSMTMGTISFLVWTGYALAKPRIGKSLSPPIRKMVLTGISISILSVFWIQACGVSSVSLTWLGIAILTGTFIPMIIARILGNRVRQRVNKFWNKEKPTSGLPIEA